MNRTANIFTATGYNKRGQPTGYTLGNGLTASLGYDNYGFPTSVSIPGIRNMEYEFDTLTGNLNWRKDVAKGLQENFTYDNLMKNRLETWQVNTGTAYGVSYAGNGNINSKTGLGMFSYNAPQPHAVSEIENTGNLVSEAEQKVRYTPFNKVDTIREGNYRLEITYGPDEARKITRLYNNNVLEKTKYYVGGNYEVEIDGSDNERKLHYIYGGDGLAAIFEKTSAAENLYYIHKDHLGSFAAVTDASGTKVEEMSFDPWGRRRNATNWTFDNMASAYLFDRGYTGHEHLDEFSLINMNGRVYDPILGRFMSPDNYIQAPDYTQNFNRYSYAWNNPLVYTDPDGEFVVAAVLIGAAISGTVGYFSGKAAGLGGSDLVFYTIANAFIGGMSGGIGASVGAGVSTSLSFGGFAGGLIAGAAGGTAGGFVAGFYSTGLNNNMFSTNDNLIFGGLKGAGFGALAGGLIGGTVAGIDAVNSDAGFWNGKYTGEVGGGGNWKAEFLDEDIPAGAKPTQTGEIATTDANPDYGKYGMTRNGGTQAHRGVDYIGEVGDDVYSMYDGKVTRMWNSRTYGPNATRISTTLNGKYYNVDYGHLSNSVLSLKQSVNAGELVGYMGRMGNIAGTSFPTHVHIAVWRPLPGNVMGFVKPWW